MSLRPSLRLLGALLVTGAVCAVPAVAKLDDPDTTPPVITITFPAEGQEITSNQGALATQFNCVDPVVPGAITSGTATCDGDATIDTTKNGDQQFTVHTTDNAGKATEKTVNYKLVDRIPPTITITSPTE